MRDKQSSRLPENLECRDRPFRAIQRLSQNVETISQISGLLTFFSDQHLLNCDRGQLQTECWPWKQAEEVGTLSGTPERGKNNVTAVRVSINRVLTISGLEAERFAFLVFRHPQSNPEREMWKVQAQKRFNHLPQGYLNC